MGYFDLASAVAMLVISALVLVATSQLSYWSDFAPGPAFLPRWVGAIGILLGTVLLIASRRPTPPQAVVSSVDDERPHHWRPLLTLGALAALAFFLPTLGLRVSTVLFVLFVLLVVIRRRLLPSIVTAAGTAPIVHVVFVRWLGIDVPSSLLGF